MHGLALWSRLSVSGPMPFHLFRRTPPQRPLALGKTISKAQHLFHAGQEGMTAQNPPATYSANEHEMLGCILAIEQWYQYLVGMDFDVLTDCAPN